MRKRFIQHGVWRGAEDGTRVARRCSVEGMRCETEQEPEECVVSSGGGGLRVAGQARSGNGMGRLVGLERGRGRWMGEEKRGAVRDSANVFFPQPQQSHI